MESSLVGSELSGTSGSALSLSGGTVTGSTLSVTSGRMTVGDGCVLTDTPISVSDDESSLTISGSELQSDGTSVPLTIESGGAATVTATVFRSTAGDITAVSVAEGGSLSVGESQLVGADGSTDPFPCDGTMPDCAGEHAGSVVVEGPSAVNMAAPLVCDVETGECLGDMCLTGLVDCGDRSICVSPLGDMCAWNSEDLRGTSAELQRGTTNANGRAFRLYLLPAQEANYFSDATGAQRYADLCAAAGLHTITWGGDQWGPAGVDCAEYGCMLVLDSGDNNTPRWVHEQTGWEDLVTHDYASGNVYNYHAGTYHHDGWGVPLHPVCGIELDATGRRMLASKTESTNSQLADI